MKNKFMRIAAVMLMLCLVTTCAISGTFAKYTTKATGDDSARVAYWGWKDANASVELGGLFVNAYDNDVQSAVDVIAPGTAGSANFQFIYAPKTEGDEVESPEVAYAFTVSTAGSGCADAIKKNPNIKWTLDGTTFETTTADGVTTYAFDKLLAAIEALAGTTDNPAEDGVASYAPSADALPDISEEEHTIEWEWVFYTNADQDVVDTEMGNTNADLDVTIVITISAVQTTGN